MPVRTSRAVWRGDVQKGEGTLGLGSGAWEGPYSFRSRFHEEEPKQSNPEELLAAGHAGCFSLAFANTLGQEATAPAEIRTTADCHLEMDKEAGPTITRIELDTEVEMTGIEEARFQELATEAKETCPVSRALGDVTITLDATLID